MHRQLFYNGIVDLRIESNCVLPRNSHPYEFVLSHSSSRSTVSPRRASVLLGNTWQNFRSYQHQPKGWIFLCMLIHGLTL